MLLRAARSTRDETSKVGGAATGTYSFDLQQHIKASVEATRYASKQATRYAFTGASSTALLANFFIAFFVFFFSALRFFS